MIEELSEVGCYIFYEHFIIYLLREYKRKKMSRKEVLELCEILGIVYT